MQGVPGNAPFSKFATVEPIIAWAHLKQCLFIHCRQRTPTTLKRPPPCVASTVHSIVWLWLSPKPLPLCWHLFGAEALGRGGIAFQKQGPGLCRGKWLAVLSLSFPSPSRTTAFAQALELIPENLRTHIDIDVSHVTPTLVAPSSPAEGSPVRSENGKSNAAEDEPQVARVWARRDLKRQRTKSGKHAFSVGAHPQGPASDWLTGYQQRT